MQDLRLVLIILGFIAIVALVAHGLWSNKKKQEQPLKDKPLKNKQLDPIDNVKDKEGFDLDGIGQKRVVSKAVEPTINVTAAEPVTVAAEKIEPQFNATETSQEVNVLSGSFSAVDVEPVVSNTYAPSTDSTIDDVSYDVVDDTETSVDDAKLDVTEIKPELAAHADVAPTTENQNSKNDSVVNDEPQDKSADEAVFVINIMARAGKQIAGAELLQELSAFGFKFGAMNIFHRHVDAAGKGPVIFSLANMVKPGVFDIDSMEQFSTPGVSIFMMFPCAGQASHNYKLMLSAAERIAEGVDGLLMDATRNPLLEEAIEQEQAFIRQLESRALAK